MGKEVYPRERKNSQEKRQEGESGGSKDSQWKVSIVNGK